MNKITEALKLAEEALNAMLTHMGMDEDEWTKPTFNQAREALAAIREELAERPIDYDQGFVDGFVDGFETQVSEQDHIANVGKMITDPWKCACGANLYIDSNGAPASKAELVNQEPVGMVIGGVFEPWNDDVLSGAWELYAAPVDAKAIRAEALEEAAKVCEETLGDHYSKQDRPAIEQTMLFAAIADCAAAIRNLMEKNQ